jgi:phosphoglycerate dehydrogenase-like enzyme
MSLVIAHQLSAGFAALVAPHLPPDVTFLALEPAWEIPDEARVLLLDPVPAPGSIPADTPAGWPHRLEWIQSVAAGMDDYPDWFFNFPRITNGRGANSFAIAEFTFAAMLAAAKNLPGVWISNAAQWRHSELDTLRGKTLGLVGFGSIAQHVARFAGAFDMEVVATRRSAGAAVDGVRFAALEQVLAAADHLVLALPLTPATHGLIGAAELRMLKPGAHLVNISRGGVLDQEALLAALDRGQPALATLDVATPEPLPAGHPLYTHPRVHLSPHISWSGGDRGLGFVKMFVENIRRFRAGEELINPVNRERRY